MLIISLLLSLIFIILSIIHLNWALGNTWGLSKALPTNITGQQVLRTNSMMTLLVALILLLFSAFYFIIPEPGNPKNWIFKYIGWAIPVLFLLRSIGEFKYIGFFKSIKSTDFAKMDSKYYSPLCLLIAIMGVSVQLFR